MGLDSVPVMSLSAPATSVFDQLFTTGCTDILVGNHHVDQVPVEGGRWPVTVVGLPDEESAERWDDRTTELLPLVGPGHFLTGRAEAVHVTVRSLEGYREAASPDEPIAARWIQAVDRTAQALRGAGPLRLSHTGFTLTSGTVMAQLEPVDDRSWQLMGELDHQLGELGWYEAGQPRDIWYANVVHFAGPIADRAGLISWVQRHRRIDPEPVVLNNLTLVRSRHQSWTAADGSPEQAMMPEVWHSARLA